MKPSRDRILEKFEYDEKAGTLIHRQTKKAGTEAGSLSNNGHGGIYRRVCIDGRKYYTHAIIYFLHTGIWPDLIDHRDTNSLNNRFDNLREADQNSNQWNRNNNKNNKLGVKGVSLIKETGKYRADICYENTKIVLGRFDTIREAKEAYDKKSAELFGEFSRF